MLNFKTITTITLTTLLSSVSLIDSAEARRRLQYSGDAASFDQITLTLIEGEQFSGTAILSVQGTGYDATDSNIFDVSLISTSQPNLDLLQINLGTFEYDLNNDGTKSETLEYNVSLRLPDLLSSELSQLSQNSTDERISQKTFFDLIETDFNNFNDPSSGSTETRFCLPFPEFEDNNIPRLCDHTSSGGQSDALLVLNDSFRDFLGLSENSLGVRTDAEGISGDDGAGLRLVEVQEISTPEPSNNFGILILGIIGSGLLLNKRIKQK